MLKEEERGHEEDSSTQGWATPAYAPLETRKKKSENRRYKKNWGGPGPGRRKNKRRIRGAKTGRREGEVNSIRLKARSPLYKKKWRQGRISQWRGQLSEKEESVVTSLGQLQSPKTTLPLLSHISRAGGRKTEDPDPGSFCFARRKRGTRETSRGGGVKKRSEGLNQAKNVQKSGLEGKRKELLHAGQKGC